MRYWLVMPAAGTGRRFGADLPKQYAPLAGRSVIHWSLAPFLEDSRCAGIVVAVADGDALWADAAASMPSVSTAPGGRERCHSVRAALAALQSAVTAEDWVLVHDAVRPCLAREDRDRLLQTLATHPLGGLLATPVADTLKQGTQAVECTLDRADLWRALTPQMFRYAVLCDALDQAIAQNRVPTDEAQAVEWAGGRPALVEGAATNLKITSPADLRMAEALLAAAPRAGAERAAGARR